jgi:hypothetical protein
MATAKTFLVALVTAGLTYLWGSLITLLEAGHTLPVALRLVFNDGSDQSYQVIMVIGLAAIVLFVTFMERWIRRS